MIQSIKEIKAPYGKEKAGLYLKYLYTLYMYFKQDYEHFSYYVVVLLNKYVLENGVDTLNHFVSFFVADVLDWGNDAKHLDANPLFEELRKNIKNTILREQITPVKYQKHMKLDEMDEYVCSLMGIYSTEQEEYKDLQMHLMTAYYMELRSLQMEKEMPELFKAMYLYGIVLEMNRRGMT